MRNAHYLSCGLVVALTVALAASAMPAGAQVAANITVLVDNQPIQFDVPPQMAYGRVLVPLRGVFERLGASVVWNDQTQTVLAQRGATSVSLVIGQNQAMINGQAVPVDVPPMVVGGRTMVPLRFVSQALGATVNWDANTSTVAIITNGVAGVPPSQTYGPGPSVPPSQTYSPGPSVPPSQTYGPQFQHIVGRLISVRMPTPQSDGVIVVSHDGTVSRYFVTGSTDITRVTPDGRGGSVSLAALRAGDRVDLFVSRDNVAHRIRATFGQ